jgi:hypothetical protein
VAKQSEHSPIADPENQQEAKMSDKDGDLRQKMAAAFGIDPDKVAFNVDIPPMVPGDSDFDFDEDGNDVTTTMIDETTVAVTVTSEVHGVLDAKLVDVPEGYGAMKFKKPQ